VPKDVGLALTRVAQEIVTNATKHSRARRLDLDLRASEGRWILEGRDNGGGTETLRPGHGLAGMRERIEGVGGVLTIDSRIGHGFVVTATVPMVGHNA
jgi:signal transduction histidine kinase